QKLYLSGSDIGKQPVIDKTLPLIDLHRHLDGNVRLETILDLARKHNIPLPAENVIDLKPFVQIMSPRPGVMAFLEKFKYMVGVLADYDACRRIAYENVEDAFLEGIDYIELRFSPVFMAETHQLDPYGVVEAVLEGIDQGQRNFDIRVNIIGIISRTYGPDQGWEELEALLAYKDHIVGLDLAGDEIHFPGSLFVDHFQEGKEAGLHITVHAGEEGGPDSIWQAIEELSAERIGHGVSAVRDPSLMRTLAEKEIGLESNLTSNVQTRVVDDYKNHPLRSFLEEGILATINTDDPGISAINLRHEYEYAAEKAGLSKSQISQAQMNAVKTAFLSDIEKKNMIDKASRRKEDFYE
ncbi:MAG: adenosine deaminase, partial [Anaerolineales bacterium]|nr:adenosine deaminase [Anaerolineales bacterium]